MLAYNLLWILDPSRSTVSNYTYRNILDTNNDIAYAGQGFLLNEVYLASRISNSSGVARINSAKEVRMLPGFIAQNGSNVHITASPFNVLDTYRGRTESGESIAKAKHIAEIAASEQTAELLEIVEDATMPQVRIYPNPTDGVLFIGSNLPIAHYELINGLGATVQRGTLPEQLDISPQKSGLYILRLYDENDKLVKVEKIVRD